MAPTCFAKGHCRRIRPKIRRLPALRVCWKNEPVDDPMGAGFSFSKQEPSIRSQKSTRRISLNKVLPQMNELG